MSLCERKTRIQHKIGAVNVAAFPARLASVISLVNNLKFH